MHLGMVGHVTSSIVVESILYHYLIVIEQELTVLVTVGDSFLSIAAVCNLLASEMFDGDQCDFLRVQFCVAFYFLASQ